MRLFSEGSHTGRRSRLRLFLAAVLAASAALVLTSAASAATITSAGPLTPITISTVLNCSVLHTGDSSQEWFGTTACGTFAVDQSTATLYGPATIPAGGAAAPRTPYTAISQVGPTGTGTSLDPFKIVTVVGLGASGLTITQTDTYVVGQESYRTDVQISNSNLTSRPVRLYTAGDCFLQNSDFGFGVFQAATGAIACLQAVNSSTPGTRIEQLFPLTAGSSYYETFFNTLWARIGAQLAGPNTCDCATYEDNAILLSWDVNVPAAGSTTISYLTTFSPLGLAPLSTTKTADSATASPGGGDGYTITIHNPNASAVSLSSITDTLPAGFAYIANSTSGATNANPQVNGQQLTWSGAFSVPGGGDITLHFGVTVSGATGTYFNNAGGDAGGVAVAPTGDTAPIMVQQLQSATATEIRNAGNLPVTTVEAGTTVHDFVTVTGQPGQPTPTGSVELSFFSSGATCAAPPAFSGTGPLDGNGQFDATGFAFTPPSGFYSFLAHYLGDGTYADSLGPCEPLQVVDAYITIGPPDATNAVGTTHTYTAAVFTNDGSGYGPAPDGTLVTFTLLPGSVGNFTGGNTCLTAGGSCTIDTTSASPGDDTMQAATTLAVAGVTMTRTTGQSAPGHANSANAVKHWTGDGKHLTYKGSMEGALHWLPGSFVNGGYHFWLSTKNPTPVTVAVSGAIEVPVHCGGPNVNPPVATISVPVSIAPFTIPANSTAKYLAADQNDILSWMAAVASPALCGAGQLMYNSEGATFNAVVASSAHLGTLNFQWHYRIPAAKNKPNTNCTDANDPNRSRADVCGASWSATKDP